jgi:hypothetical protein
LIRKFESTFGKNRWLRHNFRIKTRRLRDRNPAYTTLYGAPQRLGAQPRQLSRKAGRIPAVTLMPGFANWIPLKTLLLLCVLTAISCFLYSSNIPIDYPALKPSKSRSSHQNRGFVAVSRLCGG